MPGLILSPCGVSVRSVFIQKRSSLCSSSTALWGLVAQSMGCTCRLVIVWSGRLKCLECGLGDY